MCDAYVHVVIWPLVSRAESDWGVGSCLAEVIRAAYMDYSGYFNMSMHVYICIYICVYIDVCMHTCICVYT